MSIEAAASRPRLLLVENSLHITGAFVSALHTAGTLRDTHDVDFVLPSGSSLHDDVAAAGIVCHSLPMSEIGRSWRKLLRYVPMLVINAWRLRRLLAQRKVTVLVINDYYNLLGVMAKAIGWRGQLLTMVRLMPMNQHRVLNRVWTALALRCSDNVVAVSKAVAQQLPASDKVQVVYNPTRFNERHPDKPTARADGEVHCLYLANYIAGKGHLNGLQAFACAYQQSPALRLRFVGGDMGLKKNRAIKASLELAAVQMGLSQVVTCDDYSSDVELDIKRADIVLNFSESESFSHTCLEASTFGRPIIATRCGGPEEIIDEGVTGLLVGIGDVPAMTAAILRLADSPAIRQEMGEAGRLAVREKFSEDAFRACFQRLLTSGGIGL